MLRYALALSFAGLVAAAAPAVEVVEAPRPMVDPAQVVPMEGYMQGTIVAVNSDSITLKPMSAGNEQKIKVPDTASIEVNGQMGSMDDLRVGQLASLMTEKQDGEIVASMIQARTQM